MADLAADYSRGLPALAEGMSNSLERQTLNEVSLSIENSIDSLRKGGAEAYAKYGQDTLEAI